MISKYTFKLVLLTLTEKVLFFFSCIFPIFEYAVDIRRDIFSVIFLCNFDRFSYYQERGIISVIETLIHIYIESEGGERKKEREKGKRMRKKVVEKRE